jgi:hypothetical protein
MLAPFPYFGGKRIIAEDVWKCLGAPSQYIEPFCGSAAMLLAAPKPASLEVINDGSGFIANFWRAVKHQPETVAEWADYPVSHIDIGARHMWLMNQREYIGTALHDPNWEGDAKVAGWWLYGQCSWIGAGWCEWDGKIPHTYNAGVGVQAVGGIPHISDAGMGVQAIGKIPHTKQDKKFLTSSGYVAMHWLTQLAARLERVRVFHGDWSRCLNHHFGGDDTAVFLDPPYRGYEEAYGKETSSIANAVEAWARENANLRIALCGHQGDYHLPGWDVVEWSRGKLTYGSSKTTDKECIWYSPACIKPMKYVWE